MLKRRGSILIFTILAMMGTACTGGAGTSGSGSITVTPGDQLTVDLSDVALLQPGAFTLSLRAVSQDFSTTSVLYDLTGMLAQAGNTSQFNLVIPKVVTSIRPILLVVDIPSLNTQLIEVVYEGDTVAKPGVASTLTYTLLKNYPGKSLSDYNSVQYQGIQNLIQLRMNSLFQDSDYLSYATTAYPKLIRYFTNGVAFNVNFLTAIRQFGVNYTFDPVLPTGLLSRDTPEKALNNYYYATNFRVGNPGSLVRAPVNPFNQINSPASLLPGSAQPNPGIGIYAPEGRAVSIAAQGYDLDDDYIDKNMIVTYTPRVLPMTDAAGNLVTTAPGFPFKPEAPSEYQTILQMTGPAGVDHYASPVVQYNEALDTSIYTPDLPYDPALYPNATNTDTAYRDVYYLISDGMLRIPYHWNFAYADVNRQPQFALDSQGTINDTSLDHAPNSRTDSYAAGLADSHADVESPPGTGWFVHASHCAPINDTAHYYEAIYSKNDGPWSCTVKMTDPDIDDDPNAAPDRFWFTVTMAPGDISTNVTFVGAQVSQIWPRYDGIATAGQFLGETLSGADCLINGVQHVRCGRGLYQIKIDNSVKSAAAAKASTSFDYSITVADRYGAGGDSVSAALDRAILIPPVPALLVNYGNLNLPMSAPGRLQPIDPTNVSLGYLRQDTSLNELLSMTNAGNQLATIGFADSNGNNVLAGAAVRGNMVAAGQTLSNYVTQPFNIDSTATVDPVTHLGASAVPGSVTLVGHNLTQSRASTYSFPREYDSSCSLVANNFNTAQGWSQTTSDLPLGVNMYPVGLSVEGWVFEIDAIDYDNVGIAVGEASDPVYVNMRTDINASLNANGIQYCAFPTPNPDPAYYQTYQATATNTAVGMDTCNAWTSLAPTQMQPVPVYYTALDNSIQKLVYHRLRMKWQPRDQGAATPTVGYIQNMIQSNMQLSGSRYLFDHTAGQDQTTVSSPINLYAQRKDMNPCLLPATHTTNNNASGITGVLDTLNQVHPSLAGPVLFGVVDQNKTLQYTPNSTGAVNGRFESELVLKSSSSPRKITDFEFLKFVLYTKDCAYEDAPNNPPVVPSPTPILRNEPMIWYSQAADAGNVPRMRFQSQSNPTSLYLGDQFCMDFSFTPLIKTGTTAYNEVILIQNNKVSPSTTSYVLTNANTNGVLGACTNRSSLTIYPDQKYVAIASSCGGSHALGATLWGNGSTNSIGVSQFILDPTAATIGGYPSSTAIKLDMFPSSYGAFTISGFPAAFDALNAMFFDAYALDTFKLDPTSHIPAWESAGLDANGNNPWTSQTNSTSFAASTSIPLTQGFAYGMQIVDWDTQPNYVAIASPTPDVTQAGAKIAIVPAPDLSTIKVYVRGGCASNTSGAGCPGVSFPIRVTDSSSGVDQDAFDIMQYGFVNPAVAATGIPTLTSANRGPGSVCTDAPAGYPALSTLNLSNLANYRMCSINWTPLKNDYGNIYIYPYKVQDNYSPGWSATVNNGDLPAGTTGVGGIYPNTDPTIPGNGGSITNGPASHPFMVYLEAIETNLQPYFTTGTGTSLASTNAYGSGTAWNSVFSGGTQPNHAACTIGGGFTCALQIGTGDTLSSTSFLSMDEGTSTQFVFSAQDDNVNVNLKTLSVPNPPTQVLIVDGPHQGETYAPTSFQTQNITVGSSTSGAITTFSFNWSPTDSDANYLSNPGGFLIPITVSDSAYSGTDSMFPTQFTVAAKTNTIWLWAKLNVKNNAPAVYYLSGSAQTETPLSGANIIMQTSQTTNLTIRVKDTDVARWNQGSAGQISSERALSFFPSSISTLFSAPGSSFLSVTSLGSPQLDSTGLYVTQDFIVSGNPAPTDIANYASQATIIDPGDPSLGMIDNPVGTYNASTNPGAYDPVANPTPRAVVAGGNTLSVGFNIQVVGRPNFLAPVVNTDPNYPSQAYAYATRQFYYPISTFVSRPSEKLQSFFIGIDSSASISPMKTTNTGGSQASDKGFYINENYVLRWPDSTVATTPGARTLPIYSVLSSYCNVAEPVGSSCVGSGKTLIRFNEGSSQIETCHIACTHFANDTAGTSMTLTLNAATTPTPPPINTAEVDRLYLPSPSPSNLNTALDQSFSDFFGRCANCYTGMSLRGISSVSTNSSYYYQHLNGFDPAYADTSSNFQFVDFSANGYATNFEIHNRDEVSGNPLFHVNEKYIDTAVSAGRKIYMSANEDETLSFSAGTATTSTYQYRWYVNGCLNSSGLVSSGTAPVFKLKVNSMMAGANNYCTGQYQFAETGASAMGKLIVRLSLDNGVEALSSSSDPSSTNYLWVISILNTDPNVITTNQFAPAAPVVINASSSDFSGNQNIQFGVPVSFSNKNYFAYTDLGTGGLSVRLRELSSNGDFASAGSKMNLTCNSAFTTTPSWIGFQQISSSLTISASNDNSYQAGSSNYNDPSRTCYTGAMTLSAPNQNTNAIGTVAAGYLPFSQYSMSTDTLATYENNNTAPYRQGSNDPDFFMIQDSNSTNKFWISSLGAIYNSPPPAESSTFSNNAVRKNIVIQNGSTGYLAQLIGAASNGSSSGVRGFVQIDSLSVRSSPNNQLLATSSGSVMFNNGLDGILPHPGANDCMSFNGSPVDGVYVGITDTLYVIANSSTDTNGHIVAVKNPTGTPTCSIVADVMNPSMSAIDHNPNVSKLAFDSTNNLIYGVINRGAGYTSQFYVYDIFTHNVVTRDMPSSMSSYEVVFSPGANAVYLFDNRATSGNTCNGGPCNPTLYKVW